MNEKQMISLPRHDFNMSRGLTEYTFRDDPPFVDWLYGKRASGIYATLINGRVAAQVVDSRVTMMIRGKPYAASLISHVATAPEFRSQGLMNELMPYALNELARDGVRVAALYPFSYKYYERFGFMSLGDAHVFSLPLRAIHAAKIPCETETLTIEDNTEEGSVEYIANIVTSVYNEYISRGGVSGGVYRSPTDMMNKLNEYARNGEYAVIIRTGGAMGYASYAFEGKHIAVSEIVAPTPDIASALMRYFASHSSTHDTLGFVAASDNHFRECVGERRGVTTLDAWCMYKPLDEDAAAMLKGRGAFFTLEQY